jgi:hypothetical protein
MVVIAVDDLVLGQGRQDFPILTKLNRWRYPNVSFQEDKSHA